MRYAPFISFPSDMKAWREYFLSFTAMMLFAMLIPPALVPYMATGRALSRWNESKSLFTTTLSIHRSRVLQKNMTTTVLGCGNSTECCPGQMRPTTIPMMQNVREPISAALATLCRSTNEEYLTMPEYVCRSLNAAMNGTSPINSPQVICQKLPANLSPPRSM